MATWFAQTTGNINAANMWNSIPAGGGTVLTWPAASGDVLVANNRTVTVNVSTNLGTTGQVRNDATGGATDGGYFVINNGVSLTANVYAGSTVNGAVRLALNAVVYIVGNSYGGTAANAYGIQVSSGTANITGNAYGGTGSGCHGVYANGGTLNHIGDGLGGLGCAGIQLAGAVTACTITGDMTGGGATNGFGLALSSNTPTINHTGNAIGGTVAPGASNAGALQTYNLTGNAIAGSGSLAFGVTNTAAGAVNVSGYAQATDTAPAVNNSGQGVVSIGETRSASNGRGAVSGAFRYASATALVHKQIAADGSVLTMKPVTAFTLPSEETVRNGVAYGGDKVGTLTGCNRHHRMSV